MTLADLKYPFFVVAVPEQLKNYDLTFAYHVLLSDDRNRAMCSDIPCQLCQFSCKDGTNRQEVLTLFAKSEFPEFAI